MKLEIRKLKFLFPVFGGFLLMASSFAADVRMTVEPQLISLLDRAVLKIEFIDCKGDAADIPEVDGLSIEYRGPQSKYNFINGKSSSSITHTYVITPSKVGDYTIGPVKVKYKGGEKELTAKLRVIKKADDKEAQQLSELMFSRISADRNNPYIHEPFGLSLKVYIRDGIQITGNFGLEGGMPEQGLDGELQWKVTRGAREEINGAIFNTYQLTTTAKALTAGTFTFQPQVQVQVVVPRQNRRPWGFDDPFFGDMFGRQETRPFVLDCNKLEIQVQPVPMAGRPASFTGGVGLFDFRVSVGPQKVKTGEPITIKMAISGKGNLSKITPPTLETDHNFKLYDVRTVPSNNPNEVRFEQVVIPTSDSVTNIPAISFSYFNSKTSDFRTITRGPFPVEVEGVPQQTAQVIAAVPTAQPETKVLGRDIVYLKPLPKTWQMAEGEVWHQTLLFRLLLAVPVLLLLLVAAVTARRNRLAGNVALARRQKAPKAARAQLQRAERALRKNDAPAFYEALWNGLADYFGHRLNLAPGEVSAPVVLARLPKKQAEVEALFNTVEQRRYGFGPESSANQTEMKELLKQLKTTLRQCERMKL